MGLIGAACALFTPPAAAQVPATLDELPPMDLGKIPHFTAEAEARSHCGRDPVVWADTGSGYFYPPGNTKYGQTKDGTFTCVSEALDANYWDSNPFSGTAKPGFVFPIDPSLLEAGS